MEQFYLKNLNTLITKYSMKYKNEFSSQDVELTDSFQQAFSNYICDTSTFIEFHKYTAVITSGLHKTIFIPNQWFVVASYACVVCRELFKYRECAKKTIEYLGENFEDYIKKLKNSATLIDKSFFQKAATIALMDHCPSEESKNQCAERLWKFVSNYSWWSGQKTIDRGDFFYSPVLNMLNLVNASQGYVAEITLAYAKDRELFSLVDTPEKFTVGLELYETEPPEYVDDLIVADGGTQYFYNNENIIEDEHGNLKIEIRTKK